MSDRSDRAGAVVFWLVVAYLVLRIAFNWGVYSAALDCDKDGTFAWHDRTYRCELIE